MILAALPFVLFVSTVKGNRQALIKDPQVRAFLLIIGFCTALLTWQQVHATTNREMFDALTHSLFNVVSIITTCGYASEDYTLWGNLPIMLFFYLNALPVLCSRFNLWRT
ncbi:MAG: hypothetical protein U5L01_06065 [Rheinheimera sp.]|nr:hypothetical protein [Rheinheimera sp.]